MAGRAVIFDLDGVLVDTTHAHAAGWRAIAHDLGLAVSVEDIERLKGVAREKALDMLIEGRKKLGAQDRERLLELKGALYRRHLENAPASLAISGVPGLLAALRRAGIAIGVASASRHAQLLLDRAQLSSACDFISDGHFNGPPKPAPDQLLFVARQLGVAPPDCFVVEDSVVGLEAARAGRMRSIGVGDFVAGFAGLLYHCGSLAEVPPDIFIARLTTARENSAIRSPAPARGLPT